MVKKNDFIELDFTAVVKETSNVFDTTLPEEAEKAGLLHSKKEKEKFKPIKVCIGQGMLLKGLDNAIENKEIGKWHEIELNPKEAFGERDAKLVKTIPLRVFREKGIMPQAGMVLNLDGILVRIAAVSSGRVISDFNNPLSGKTIIYKFRVNRIVENQQEKLEILTEFLLGKAEKTSIENGKGIIEFPFKMPEAMSAEFSKRVKEIMGVDAEIRELKKEGKKAEKPEPGENGKIRTERPYNE